MPAVVPSDMFTNALQLLGVQGAAETSPNAEDTEFMRRTFNRLAGQWNARKRNCYFIQTQSFTFPRTDRQYTIGASTNTPAPDFALVGQDRPLALMPIARLILTGFTPPNYLMLSVINWDQYNIIPVPTVTATIPNTIYYQPTVPNGTLFVWTEPTVLSNKLEISWANQLTQIAQTAVATPINMPDGYEEAFTLTLAEKAWLAFPKKTDLTELKTQARLARADAFSNNVPPPKIDTRGGAIRTRRSGFNWLTRDPG